MDDKSTSPRGLTLDLINDLIYWTDYRERRIELANLDGTNRHTGYTHARTHQGRTGHLTYRAVLYWGCLGPFGAQKCTKTPIKTFWGPKNAPKRTIMPQRLPLW